MKIVVCGSITFLEDMRKAKKELEKQGYSVIIPDSIEQNKAEEDAEIKIKYNLIRNYYKKIKRSDAVLMFNKEKKEIKNYVGGNSFLECGFAHVLNKKLYFLNPIPKKVNYHQELIAMQPIVINGDLAKIKP